MSNIRSIAIHLPQFHPIPQNDDWWGKGFTEWANVTRAKPLFKGHHQPHLPADLGFYDLRLADARLAQEALAKEYGIYGFCYYHYWFNGERLLHEPLDRKLKNPEEDLPFMLCWANENWTRRWDGEEKDILMEQKYSLNDHRAHARFLCNNFFKDSRYIKVNNKPVFIFYKTFLIPEIKEAIRAWREEAALCGLDGLYLLCMDNFIYEDALSVGFDAAIHFHPDYRYFQKLLPPWKDRLLRRLKLGESFFYKHHVEDYEQYNKRITTINRLVSSKVYPGITPGWDNTARKTKDGIIFLDSSPQKYKKALNECLSAFKPFSKDENFLFINAWNEWAEGNHLEPCKKWGRQYLEVTKQVLKNSGV